MNKQAAYKVLRDVHDVFKELGVTLYLQLGTALGIVREGDLLDYDKDIDLCILYENVDALIPASTRLIDMGYAVRSLSKPFGRTRILKIDGHHVHCDVWAVMLDGDVRFGLSALRNRGNVVPARLFEDPKTITFRDMNFLLPHPVEEYLVEHYGEGWRVPDPKDTRSRCRVVGYQPGSGMLLRNIDEKRMDGAWNSDPGSTKSSGRYDHFLTHPDYQEKIFKRIAYLLSNRMYGTSTSLLDVGCGRGHFAQYMRTPVYLLEYPFYFGIDGSPSAIDYARKNFAKKVHDATMIDFETARLESFHWTSPPRHFNTILMSGILHCLVRPEFHLQFIEHYRQAFRSSLLVVTDLIRLNSRPLEQTYKKIHHEDVELKIEGLNEARRRRKIEIYELK